MLLGLLVLPRATLAAVGADVVESARNDFLTLHGDRPIDVITIEGLHRTKPAVVREWVTVHEGDRLSRFDAHTTWENLSRLGIFSHVDIGFVPLASGGVEIRITVAEKWSLYPVPMLIYWNDTQIAGLVLAESNAFGYNKGWALGGIYSNRGWYTIASYVDPNIAFSNFYGKLSVLVGSGLLENQTPDGRTFQSFDLDRYDVQYSIGYTIAGKFSPTLTGAFRSADVGTIHVPAMEAPVAGSVVSQGIKLIYNDRRARLYYDKGLRSSIEYQHAFSVGKNDLSFDNLITETSYTTETIFDHTLQLGLYWARSQLPLVFEHRLGGLEGTRTLPAGLVPADRYLSATAIYQIPFWKGSWGTATVLGLIEGGRYKQDGRPGVPYWGPGGGLSIYLAKVTTPTIGVDVAYEMMTGTPTFSLAIGFRPTR